MRQFYGHDNARLYLPTFMKDILSKQDVINFGKKKGWWLKTKNI